jgi:glycosyltransferase involved in cell wall biosynthesis
MPPNAKIVQLRLGAARQLYAESAAVVVPLHANPIGAGTAVMVEAMLAGKPVIISRSEDGTFAGRRDLVDGENVIMVGAGDVPGWRNALERLMTDKELRCRIGAANGQRSHANREEWLKIMFERSGERRGSHVPLLGRQVLDPSWHVFTQG